MQNSTKYRYIFAFISPALVVFHLMFSKNLINRKILWTFLSVLFGTTFYLSRRADAFRHRRMVSELYYDMTFSEFLDDTYKIITFQISSSSADLYKHIISFISGTLFNAQGLFFLIVSLVYGYFMCSSMIIIFRNFDKKKLILLPSLILITVFFLNKNLEGMTTVRTWTGMWILIYGILMYLTTNKKKYFLLIFSVPFIHAGYLLMALPAYIALLIKDLPKVFIALFVLSFFFNFVDQKSISGFTKGFSLIEQKTTQYNQEEYMSSSEKLENFDTQKTGRTWYKRLYHSGHLEWPIYGMIILFYFYGLYPKLMSPIESKLFSIGVLTYTGSNVFFFVWAASNRMLVIGGTIVLASIVMLLFRDEFWRYYHKEKVFKNIFNILCIALIPKLMFNLSSFLGVLSIYFIAAPFVVWIDDSVNISVMDFIKLFIGLKNS